MPEVVATEQLSAPSSKQAINQTAVQEPTGLQQEVHDLADSLMPEQKTSGTPAQRESIFDEQGRIIDVKFTQGDNTRTLKEILPGSYTIQFYQDERPKGYIGVADFLENTIRINDSPRRIQIEATPFFAKENVIQVPESDINHTLLHEAGHMVDYQNNVSLYQQLETERDKAEVTWYLLLAKEHVAVMQNTDAPPLVRDLSFQTIERILQQNFPDKQFTHEDLTDGNKVMENMFEVCKKTIEEDRRRLTPQQFEEVHQAFEDAGQYIKDHPFEERNKRYEESHETANRYHAKIHALRERHAEALALKAHREFKRQGIITFAGTQAELRDTVQCNLNNYERGWGKYLDPADHRIAKSVAPSRRRMQEPAISSKP